MGLCEFQECLWVSGVFHTINTGIYLEPLRLAKQAYENRRDSWGNVHDGAAARSTHGLISFFLFFFAQKAKVFGLLQRLKIQANSLDSSYICPGVYA